MGWASDLDIHRRNGGTEAEWWAEQGIGCGELSDIAEKLGGHCQGRMVVTPWAAIQIDPAQPHAFFIYDCAGDIDAARNKVEKLLNLKDVKRSSPVDRQPAALKIWSECVPGAGTLVEDYLRSRGITLPVPDRCRFHERLWHTPSKSAWPGMVSLVTDIDDRPKAIHRTFLMHRGMGIGKAPVEPAKMTLGPCEGNAVRLGPMAEHIGVAEGIETTLSVMQMTGVSCWSANSAYGMRKLALPPEVRRVTLLADGEAAGRNAADDAACRFTAEQRDARIKYAPEGKDFNDMLLEATSK
jgi:hypothetical protein